MPRKQYMTPLPSVAHACIGPGTMVMLQQVVDDAWRTLVHRDDPVASPDREGIVREILAHRVMECAVCGEDNPARILEYALLDFPRAN